MPSSGLAVGPSPVSGVRPILAVPFSGDVNCVSLCARPLLRFALCVERTVLLSVNKHHVMGYSVGLIV
jgi:hypothetical protein